MTELTIDCKTPICAICEVSFVILSKDVPPPKYIRPAFCPICGQAFIDQSSPIFERLQNMAIKGAGAGEAWKRKLKKKFEGLG